MKIMLDACVWGGARAALEAAGHDVVWAGDWEQDPGDDEIMALAPAVRIWRRRNRVLQRRPPNEPRCQTGRPLIGFHREITRSPAFFEQHDAALSARVAHNQRRAVSRPGRTAQSSANRKLAQLAKLFAAFWVDDPDNAR